MNAVADVRGLKRICMECGMRFYDLNKRPVVCPGCAVEFSGEVKLKSRRGRNAVEEEKPKAVASDKIEDKSEDTEEDADGGAEIISLDDPEVSKMEEETPAAENTDDSDDDDDALDDPDEDLGSLDELEADAEADSKEKDAS